MVERIPSSSDAKLIGVYTDQRVGQRDMHDVRLPVRHESNGAYYSPWPALIIAPRCQATEIQRLVLNDWNGPHSHCPISSNTRNIGRYMAIMMPPTMAPTTTIRTGSIIDVSAATVASTSAS